MADRHEVQRPLSKYASQPPAASTQRLVVLIAEPSAHFRETIRRVLASHEHCVIQGEATTVSEVTAKIRAHKPDLVLLDLNLAPKDALKVLSRVASRSPDVKIAVLLSDDTPEYRSAASAHGAFYCVGKDHLEEHLAWVIYDAEQRAITGVS